MLIIIGGKYQYMIVIIKLFCITQRAEIMDAFLQLIHFDFIKKWRGNLIVFISFHIINMIAQRLFICYEFINGMHLLLPLQFQFIKVDYQRQLQH
jgi:hypothetical protein